MELLERFQSHCLRNGLLQPGEKILMGVSGGVDSISLLDLICRVRGTFDLSLAVAHFNHGLRGNASDADEAFVKSQCAKRGIPFFRDCADVLNFSRSEKRSIEEAARILRFRFFRDLLAWLRFDKIALGHQADDQAETVLLRLVRGAGLKGMAGIRSLDRNVIHPLLFATRSEIESYATFRGIEFRIDQSNFDLRYRRNWVRRGILQDLKTQFGNGVVRTIGRFGEIALETQAFVDHEAEKAFSVCVQRGQWGEIILDICPFLGYFRTIQKAVLGKIWSCFFPEQSVLNHRDYERLLILIEKGKSGKKILFPNQIEAVKSGGRVIFIQLKRSQTEEIPVSVGEWIPVMDGIRFRAEIRDAPLWKNGFKFDNPCVEHFDYEKIVFPLRIRYYQSGDNIVPLGMQHSKKLKTLFIDQKIPNSLRKSIPLLADAKSLLWIMGVRMHDRVKVTQSTKTVLRVEFETRKVRIDTNG
jgi:tRNA(Ile)-lysidine synthase